MTIKAVTYAIYTLGCKLNFSESSAIMQYFDNMNFKKRTFSEKADIYLINTCSVTANANKKSRNAISRATKNNPDAIIIATGCYAQLNPDEIKNKFKVDYIIGINNKNEIKKITKKIEKQKRVQTFHTPYKKMNSFFPSFNIGNRTRAFLKIQDGCDYFCSYCVVPYARGKSRNQSIEETIKQVDIIASENIKEIVITGVNIGDFGKSTGESFYELLQELCKTDKIKRFRLGSIEPNLLDDKIIRLIANNPKLMPHFHIPLQSGSDNMLKIMKRKYDTALVKHKIELINKLIPHAFIGIDVIAGVNGETEEYFEESVMFLKSINISSIHVFTYSERENTKALENTPKPSPTIKRNRANILKQISEIKHHNFLKKHLKHKTKVLFESYNKNGKITGFSENYIQIETEYKKQLINKIVDIEIADFINSKKMLGKTI